MTPPSGDFPCIEAAWRNHHHELRHFLIRHCGNRDDADDLLQRVYAKALIHREQFCELTTPRAWLYQVARHQWIDDQRRAGRLVDGDPPERPAVDASPAPLESLAGCIARALPHLLPADRDILQRCDLEGSRQADFAKQHDLTLPATKARLRRARQRLRERLIEQCKIVFDAEGRVCCHKADEPLDLSCHNPPPDSKSAW
ncbi:RNA polymerase sigma-70 factor, ECF subfamily [Modicisalibacter ilicicola DSM 19980]|uniref:RNA polymerase sigma factor n=1 Tax=Modicisalibacter ilicicola DSM 19980 TaxID=1121942 RepID=A0A1M4XHN5_9GAMM|nr:sigma-70 family RNA polymerase sigma factor [Halomonas ilicicola]SHE93019.1 RNA polymerase sigma-70 factor, ECF subfamily [Halomonas ilicicola DSM 19980]